MTDVAGLMRELEQRANKLDDASNELLKLTYEFDGDYEKLVDPQTGQIVRGKWQLGPKLEYEAAVAVAAEEIADEYEAANKRVPGQERLERKGELRVKARQPDLWEDYHRLDSRINALDKWVRARTKTLSARQSVLSAEKALVNG